MDLELEYIIFDDFVKHESLLKTPSNFRWKPDVSIDSQQNKLKFFLKNQTSPLV